jgi:hypothetical protein
MPISYLYLAVVVLLAAVCWCYVGLIDFMRKNYPDYEGEDFLQEEKPKGKVIDMAEKPK